MKNIFHLLHGNSLKAKHPYNRASQSTPNVEHQLLESNKPHKVYEDFMAAPDLFASGISISLDGIVFLGAQFHESFKSTAISNTC